MKFSNFYFILDVETDVQHLRKWLKEMEQRIDPLQFRTAASWSTRDIEKKIAEYQVNYTDVLVVNNFIFLYCVSDCTEGYKGPWENHQDCPDPVSRCAHQLRSL